MHRPAPAISKARLHTLNPPTHTKPTQHPPCATHRWRRSPPPDLPRRHPSNNHNTQARSILPAPHIAGAGTQTTPHTHTHKCRVPSLRHPPLAQVSSTSPAT